MFMDRKTRCSQNANSSSESDLQSQLNTLLVTLCYKIPGLRQIMKESTNLGLWFQKVELMTVKQRHGGWCPRARQRELAESGASLSEPSSPLPVTNFLSKSTLPNPL